MFVYLCCVFVLEFCRYYESRTWRHAALQIVWQRWPWWLSSVWSEQRKRWILQQAVRCDAGLVQTAQTMGFFKMSLFRQKAKNHQSKLRQSVQPADGTVKNTIHINDSNILSRNNQTSEAVPYKLIINV